MVVTARTTHLVPVALIPLLELLKHNFSFPLVAENSLPLAHYRSNQQSGACMTPVQYVGYPPGLYPK
jgi:hypothetical protein